MASSKAKKTVKRSTSERDARTRQMAETHDPEFEMPDPKQVDRDIEQAERVYGSSEGAKRGSKKRSA